MTTRNVLMGTLSFLLLSACSEPAAPLTIMYGDAAVAGVSGASVERLDGESVSGTIYVSIRAEGWMKRVVFSLNDRTIADLTVPPFGVAIDTALLVNGVHTVTVEPYLANGRTRGGTTVQFTVDNGTPDSGNDTAKPGDDHSVDPGPGEPGPVEPGPVEPGPVELGPVEPGPVEPGPVGPGPADPDPEPTPGSARYLDCQAGDDRASGMSPTTAWRTLGRLSGVVLAPGETLLLRRGCQWVGPLQVPWNGTSTDPITVGAYGVGDRPAIRDSSANHVNISGSYLIIEQLQAFTTAGTLPVDRGCANQPVAWRTGFTLQSSAHHVTIRHSLAFGNTAGIHVGRGAHHNRILHNELRDNVVLSRNTVGGDDDSGAWGIVLNGSDNVIANNRFSNNFAWCSYDYGQEGASIEIYEAQRNLIHHNVSIDDATFIEVGSSRTRASQDNVIAYNTYTTGRPIAEFLVVHAGGSFGPTVRTEAYNNTVYLPHTDRTQGVVCHAGCGPDIMTLRNNVLVVGWKALYTDGAFNESNNLYWRPGGRTLVQFFGGSSMSSTSMIVDPGFVNPSLLDFRVQDRSPVINAGTTIPVTFAADANGQPVPQGAAPDIGAHEFQGGFMAARAP